MDQNQAATPLDPTRHFLVTVAVMLAVLMQVLDTTIANVALPHMQSSLGATQESINWVLTSYIVASAIAIPIAGWLAERIGRRKLLLIAVVGFTAASTSVVIDRSYSRYSWSTCLEMDTTASGCSSASTARIRSSCSGLA